MSPSILVSTSFFFYTCSSSENKSSAALSIKEHNLREERSNRPLLSYHSSDSNGTTCPEVFLKASETGSSFTSFNTSDCIDRRCLNARDPCAAVFSPTCQHYGMDAWICSTGDGPAALCSGPHPQLVIFMSVCAAVDGIPQ